jgi:hypothetical protein
VHSYIGSDEGSDSFSGNVMLANRISVTWNIPYLSAHLSDASILLILLDL